MDEFPVYFEDYPRVATIRASADRTWLEPLRSHLRGMCDRARALGMAPAFHLYEPMLPLAFEREYPELVGVWRRPTQMGVHDTHTRLDPDNPETWKLMASKYRALAQHPQFQSTHGLLRHYVAAQSPDTAKLQLPSPPPTGGAN